MFNLHQIKKAGWFLGCFFLATASGAVQAGGVALGATRVVYPAGAKQTSLAVTNSDKNVKFLIQTWVDDSNGKKTSDFIITPPLFVSKPRGENTLRIMYTGPELAKDREQVYWINAKAIPAVDREAIKGKNVLQLAVVSRIKLFVRPAGLEISPAQAPEKLTFSRQGNTLIINNPTPYYQTLVNLNVGLKNLANTMVPPKSSASVDIPVGAAGAVTYQTINDYGANTPKMTGVMR